MKASGFLSGRDQVRPYLAIVALDFRPPWNDENSLFVGLNIRKKELYVKGCKPQDIKEGFRPVLHVTITK
jgi:hypothetical protein